MSNNSTSSHKSSGRRQKPITVELTDRRVIDAVNHIKSENNRLLHLYIDEFPGEGIDVTVPLTDGACTAYARSERGREALDIERGEDAHSDDGATVASEDCEIMTDGGADR